MASSLQDHFSGEHSGDIVALHVSLLQLVTQMKDKDYNIFLPANIARFYHKCVSRRWRPEPVFVPRKTTGKLQCILFAVLFDNLMFFCGALYLSPHAKHMYRSDSIQGTDYIAT